MWPAPSSAKSRPGFQFSPAHFEAVVAPEHARFAAGTPMNASADFERWQRGIASVVPASV